MGHTWEVLSLVPHDTEPFKYVWREVYRGESWWRAVLAAHEEKRRYGLGCVQVNWR